jgi:hypothetical protein
VPRPSFRDLLVDNTISNGSCMVARKEALAAVGHFDRNLESCVDMDLWLRIARLRPGNILCIPEILSLYRRHRRQISANWKRMADGWEQMLAKLHRLAPEEVGPIAAKASANWYRYLSYLAYEQGSTGTAGRLWAMGLRQAPGTFVRFQASWMLGLAILSRLLLPSPAHAWLEAKARRILYHRSAKRVPMHLP